jgi:hypothetical protein
MEFLEIRVVREPTDELMSATARFANHQNGLSSPTGTNSRL